MTIVEFLQKYRLHSKLPSTFLYMQDFEHTCYVIVTLCSKTSPTVDLQLCCPINLPQHPLFLSLHLRS